MKEPSGPLRGVTVLELGGYIAGPFCARLLADMGARVIKVEPPVKGDPLRSWGSIHTTDGSLWWLVQARNKESVVADLRTAEGQEIVRRVAKRADVVIENFTPGRLEEWGLGPEELRAVRRDIIVVRISGFGQTGPYCNRPTFGTAAEAMGGLRYLTGEADGPPMRVGLSLADSVSGIYGAMGACAALHRRALDGVGDVVDVALTESVFSLTESVLPEYGYSGAVRKRMGNRLSSAAPSNTFLTRDEQWIAIGGNGDGIFERLALIMTAPGMAEDPRFATNESRRAHVDELEQVIGAWVAQHELEEVWRMLNEAGVPAGPIYSVEQIVRDPQFRARGMVCPVDVDGVGEVLMPAPVPRFSTSPSEVRWAGPPLGEDHDRVMRELGLNGSPGADRRSAAAVKEGAPRGDRSSST